MVAICSDLDETPDREVYWQTARYLNTTEPTAMGDGLGLEVGNTIYFDMDPQQFAYWNTDDRGREMVRQLIHSGHIDGFHSYGDLATTRRHAARALDELARHGCKLAVWIDHATAVSNFGADVMQGSGDVPGAEAYHADLTCGFGVEYVWRGRVTSVIGQDVPRRLGGIFTRHHPLASARTLAKERVKGWLARLGRAKYAMHGPNEVLRPARLRDGRPVQEFLRANSCWQAVDAGATAEGLASVLVRPMLDRLIARKGVCVLYTHLGKVRDPKEPLPPETRRALQELAALQRAGQVLVTTTRRLLDFCTARRRTALRISESDQGFDLHLTAPDTTQTGGVTVYVADPSRTRLWVNGRAIDDVERNPPDETGRPSVSVPWTRLEFPRL